MPTKIFVILVRPRHSVGITIRRTLTLPKFFDILLRSRHSVAIIIRRSPMPPPQKKHFQNIGTFPHFVCIAVRQGPTLPLWLDISVRPPFSLHYRTHRLHAAQNCQNMGTSPNSSSLCHTYRVNAGHIDVELLTPFEYLVQCLKLRFYFFVHFPRFNVEAT